MNTDLMFSSATDQWATPQEFFNKLNAEFVFTLDVAAQSENAKCKHFYTREQDGLKQVWKGRCFMNPPYGREIGKWVEKAYISSKTSADLVVCLLPSRTDTKWFQDFILPHAEIRFIRGRLKFGNSKNAAPFPSLIAIFKK